MPTGRLQTATLPADLAAGTTTALVGIPQAMGFALVAGINPLYGLYTAAFSTAIGAFLTGSTYLKVMLSNVLAVSIYSVLAPVPEADVPATLFVLTLLVGIFQLGFGLIKAGSLTRFISNAVLTGFIVGGALLIVLGQLGNLTGLGSRKRDRILAIRPPPTRRRYRFPGLAIGLLTIGSSSYSGEYLPPHRCPAPPDHHSDPHRPGRADRGRARQRYQHHPGRPPRPRHPRPCPRTQAPRPGARPRHPRACDGCRSHGEDPGA